MPSRKEEVTSARLLRKFAGSWADYWTFGHSACSYGHLTPGLARRRHLFSQNGLARRVLLDIPDLEAFEGELLGMLGGWDMEQLRTASCFYTD